MGHSYGCNYIPWFSDLLFLWMLSPQGILEALIVLHGKLRWLDANMQYHHQPCFRYCFSLMGKICRLGKTSIKKDQIAAKWAVNQISINWKMCFHGLLLMVEKSCLQNSPEQRSTGKTVIHLAPQACSIVQWDHRHLLTQFHIHAIADFP